MKQLLTQIHHKIIRPAVLVFAAVILAAQGGTTAFAASPLANNPLTVSTNAELDRRSATLTLDKTNVQKVGSNPVSDALVKLIDDIQQTISTRKDSLSTAPDTDHLVVIAQKVDGDYPDFRSADLASRLFTDLKAQDTSLQQLRNLAQQIQDTVSAARANGATHVNAGVAGFIKLDLIDQNVDKLKKSLTSAAIITVSLDSIFSLLSDNNDLADNSTATTFTQLYDQLSVTQTTLSDVSLGLSQLSNVVSGNRSGVSICGWWNNCRGMENNGAILSCGVASNCSGSKNNGGNESCGFVSNCSNSTNIGNKLNCGIASNCSNDTNTGTTSVSCGFLSNCANDTNTGLFVNCGIASICAGSKNNAVSESCGFLSYCANRQNNGLNQNCGALSNCENNVNRGISQECGFLSNCSNSQNTGIVQNCGALSDCASSVNNGVAITCGTLSNCSHNTNNGSVIQCGALSNCSGSTNNGLLMVCGVLSNCSGSTNNVFVSMCGDLSNCSGGTTHAFITICGNLSNCSATVSQCRPPATTASDESVQLPLGLRSVSV